MSASHTREVLATGFRPIAPLEMARIVREAELMRGEYLARLVHSLGRSMASGTRSLAALLTPAGTAQGATQKL